MVGGAVIQLPLAIRCVLASPSLGSALLAEMEVEGGLGDALGVGARAAWAWWGRR